MMEPHQKPGNQNVKLAAAAVPGCRHAIGGGVLCQDAAKACEIDGIVVLAAADGHGDTSHPRSDQGARIAVEAAASVLNDALASIDDTQRFINSKQSQQELFKSIKRNIAIRWNRQVKLHNNMCDAVLTDANQLTVSKEDRSGSWEKNILKLYGTTLLAAAFTSDFGIVFQLGDGAILLVGSDGKTIRPFEPVDKTFGTTTHSLCAEDWIDHAEIKLIDRRNTPICLAMLNTDGVVDPYDNPSEYELEWGEGFLDHLESSTWPYVISQLTERLSKVSQMDGDDVTAVVAYWPDVIHTKLYTTKLEIQNENAKELLELEAVLDACICRSRYLRENPQYMESVVDVESLYNNYVQITKCVPQLLYRFLEQPLDFYKNTEFSNTSQSESNSAFTAQTDLDMIIRQPRDGATKSELNKGASNKKMSKEQRKTDGGKTK